MIARKHAAVSFAAAASSLLPENRFVYFYFLLLYCSEPIFFFLYKNFNSNDNTNNNDRRADVYDACCRPLRSALVGYEQLEYDRIIVDYLPLMSRSSASVLSLLLLLIKLD